jgi:hypothetical protein
MSMVMKDEIAEVFGRVEAWPVEARRALAEKILGTIADAAHSGPDQNPRTILHGLFKIDGPAPTDEECRQILEEELMRKHLR